MCVENRIYWLKTPVAAQRGVQNRRGGDRDARGGRVERDRRARRGNCEHDVVPTAANEGHRSSADRLLARDDYAPTLRHPNIIADGFRAVRRAQLPASLDA
jgi:hypothetical protein